MENVNKSSKSKVSGESGEVMGMFLEDAFRVEEYDHQDDTYLVTSLIAEAMGYASVPSTDEELDALEVLIDMGVIPGVKGGYVRCDGGLDVGNVYYGKIHEDAELPDDEWPQFVIEAECSSWGYAIGHKLLEGQFLKSIVLEGNNFRVTFTDSPMSAYPFHSTRVMKSYIDHYKTLLDEKFSVVPCIYYVMRDIVHVSELTLE